MKKKALYALAACAGLVGAANFVPGFWSVLPASIADSVPTVVRPYVGLAANVATVAVGNSAAKGTGPATPAANAPPGRGGAPQGRPTPVVTAQVQRKNVPFRVDSIGTVQPIASVTLRARVDSQIEQILFQDGATVKEGDILVKLDARAVDAQLRQAEGNLARDRANLDLARRTLARGETLASKDYATKQRIDENRGAVSALEGQVRADEAQLDNLKAQLSYFTIKAPISGKAGLANIKPGNIARSSDGAIALTTINQMSPIYVSFSLPQKYFQELRDSIERGDSSIEALPQGMTKAVTGKLALVENTMDNATGTIGVRGIFENPGDLLWPGAICNLKVTLRMEPNAVVVPRESVQLGQRGTYVFIVVDGVAKMQLVTVARSIDRETIVLSGLKGDETVITDGQLLIVDGARVQPRQGASSALAADAAANKL